MRLSRTSSSLIAVTKGLDVSENATTFAASVTRVASQRPNFQAALDLFSPLWPSLPSRVAAFSPVIDSHGGTRNRRHCIRHLRKAPEINTARVSAVMRSARRGAGSGAGRGTAAYADDSLCGIDVVPGEARNPCFSSGQLSADCSPVELLRIISRLSVRMHTGKQGPFYRMHKVLHFVIQYSCTQVVGAMCNLQSLVLARVPASVLRSKFVASSQIIVSVVEQSNEQVIALQ